jgi:hypothetical protein
MLALGRFRVKRQKGKREMFSRLPLLSALGEMKVPHGGRASEQANTRYIGSI